MLRNSRLCKNEKKRRAKESTRESFKGIESKQTVKRKIKKNSIVES